MVQPLVRSVRETCLALVSYLAKIKTVVTDTGYLFRYAFVLCIVLGYGFRRLVSLVNCYLYYFRIQTPEVCKLCLLFDCLWFRYHLIS